MRLFMDLLVSILRQNVCVGGKNVLPRQSSSLQKSAKMWNKDDDKFPLCKREKTSCFWEEQVQCCHSRLVLAHWQVPIFVAQQMWQLPEQCMVCMCAVILEFCALAKLAAHLRAL